MIGQTRPSARSPYHHPTAARAAGLLAAAAVAALVAGCSGGSSSAAPATSGTAAPTGATSASAGTSGGSPSSPALVTKSTVKSSSPRLPAGNGEACPSLGLVKATLGVTAGDPAENTTAENVLVCSYPNGGNPSSVIVRIQEKQTKAGFLAAKAGFAKNGQKTEDVAGLFDAAYRSELGSATYGYTRTLVVLRGSTEVLITGRTTYDGLFKLAHTMLD